MLGAAPKSSAMDGFALLEAVVALTILATAMIAIGQLVMSAIDGARRIAKTTEAAMAESNALEVMASVNPMRTPSGAIDLGAYRVTWSAHRLVIPREQTGYPQGQGIYMIALYDTDVRVERSTCLVTSFHVKQVGYEQIRQPPVTQPQYYK